MHLDYRSLTWTCCFAAHRSLHGWLSAIISSSVEAFGTRRRLCFESSGACCRVLVNAAAGDAKRIGGTLPSMPWHFRVNGKERW
jgi:hypothetical protein